MCAQGLLTGWAEWGEVAETLQVPSHACAVASLLSSILHIQSGFPPGAEQQDQAGTHCLCLNLLRQVPVGRQVGFP